MDSIYVILIILALILFTMGVIVSLFQKRMMRINLDNTLSMTNRIDIGKNINDNSTDMEINTISHPAILKHCDTDELLDFIDDEIL